MIVPMSLATLLIFLAVSFFGCAPKQQNETIAGVVVPIPAPMKKLPTSEDRLDLGLEQKGEQVSFRGEISPSEIVRFYHDVLAPGNWQPDARLGAEVGGYVFTRGAQTIAIRVTENDSKTSTLTVLVKAGEYKPAGP